MTADGVKPTPKTLALNAEPADKATEGLAEAFELFRRAIQMAQAAATEGKADQAVASLLAQAETTAKISEAAFAEAFGNRLCRCDFPPTPMLLVGVRRPTDPLPGAPVLECPRCAATTAGIAPFRRTRIKLKDRKLAPRYRSY